MRGLFRLFGCLFGCLFVLVFVLPIALPVLFGILMTIAAVMVPGMHRTVGMMPWHVPMMPLRLPMVRVAPPLIAVGAGLPLLLFVLLVLVMTWAFVRASRAPWTSASRRPNGGHGADPAAGAQAGQLDQLWRRLDGVERRIMELETDLLRRDRPGWDPTEP